MRIPAPILGVALSGAFYLACGGDDGGSADAAPQVPAMISISGMASARSLSGSMPVPGVAIVALKASDDSMVAMATTDAGGLYTITIPTNGMPVDGYLKASITGYLTTYLYPPYPLTADFGSGSLNMLTTNTRDLLSTIAQGNQQGGMGLIALEVVDKTNATVGGAMVSSSPAGNPVRYDGSNGLPSSSATMTDADGVAYLFNVAPGTVTVSATGAKTFRSHAVKAYADNFTTTLVSE